MQEIRLGDKNGILGSLFIYIRAISWLLVKVMYEDEWVDEAEIKREKQKARELRRTSWWLRRINEGKCHYCGMNVGAKELTMDHIVPLSRGGKSKKGNVVAACKECNNKKKYLLPIEWEEYISSLKKDEIVV